MTLTVLASDVGIELNSIRRIRCFDVLTLLALHFANVVFVAVRWHFIDFLIDSIFGGRQPLHRIGKLCRVAKNHRCPKDGKKILTPIIEFSKF